MHVTSIKDSAPVVEHNGTVPIWDLLPPDDLREATEGGFLELICEMHIVEGGRMGEHSHPTHEYYYVIDGIGSMDVGEETREISAGDLVYIPPDAVHALEPIKGRAMRLLVFAIGLPGAPREERVRN